MRRLAWLLAFAVVAICGWWRWHLAQPPRHSEAAIRTAMAAPAAHDPALKLAALAREISPDEISPIADGLNAPNGTINRDLEILNEVFVAWQTNFPRQGNPVGENFEITAALAGDNPLHFAFVRPNHRAINAQGELCDRWGTPFRFHQRGGTQMEIRSAGPDRRFGTPDDVEFAPWPKLQ